MEAIVLAGGLGTRLRSVVSDRPKVLAPVGGRPFLWWVLANLASAGFRRSCVSVGYLGQQIIDALGDRIDIAGHSMKIIYASEDVPLGTGGALATASRALKTNSPVFALNGDTFINLDWTGMLETHEHGQSRLSIAVRCVADVARYGSLQISAGRVSTFGEKSAVGAGMINAGVYVLESCLFDLISAQTDSFSFEKDLVAAKLDEISPNAFVTTAAFLDIGIPEDYDRASAFLSVEAPAAVRAASAVD